MYLYQSYQKYNKGKHPTLCGPKPEEVRMKKCPTQTPQCKEQEGEKQHKNESHEPIEQSSQLEEEVCMKIEKKFS